MRILLVAAAATPLITQVAELNPVPKPVAAFQKQQQTEFKVQDRIVQPAPALRWSTDLDAQIARHAAANGVPLELARRVVQRESGGNPRAIASGNYGLMQIRLGTARAMGYQGDGTGLLDADTNMTYAMRYLAGALRAAGGDQNRAVALYARGYYPEAKAQGFSPYDSPRAAAAGIAILPQLR